MEMFFVIMALVGTGLTGFFAGLFLYAWIDRKGN